MLGLVALFGFFAPRAAAVQKKKAVNLDELFGPQSPPRLFDTDDLVSAYLFRRG